MWRAHDGSASARDACFCSRLLYVACMTEIASVASAAASRRLTRAQKIARLRDALAREISREKEERRRAETRRKIMLGAALIALLSDPTLPPVSKHSLAKRLLAAIAERDRADVAVFLSSLLPPDLPSAENRTT